MAKDKIFLFAILGSTLLPLIGLPITSYLVGPLTMDSVYWDISILIGGYGHVAATLFFYFDDDAKDLRESQRAYFFAIPFLVVTSVTFSYHFGPTFVRGTIVLSFLAWLFYHYQKQNYGIILFISKGLTESVSRNLWRMLLLSTIGGYFSFSRIPFGALNALTEKRVLVSGYNFSISVGGILYTTAVMFYVAAGIVFCIILYQSPAIRRNYFAFFSTAAGFAFFLPTFFTELGALAIFWSFAFAHGIQYLIFVTVTATSQPSNDSPRLKAKPILVFIAAVLGGGAIITFFEIHLAGIAMGITCAHFIIDSRVWKLRHPKSRAYVFSKFSFLFDSTTSSTREVRGAMRS